MSQGTYPPGYEPPEGAPPLDKLKLITIDPEYTSKNVQQTKERFGEIFSN